MCRPAFLWLNRVPPGQAELALLVPNFVGGHEQMVETGESVSVWFAHVVHNFGLAPRLRRGR